MRAHDAEHEPAVAAAQRSHGKTVLHAGVRGIPLAPRQHAGKVGFEIGAMEHGLPDLVLMQHQHAAVPERRVGSPQRVEMRGDLGPPLVLERPRSRCQCQFEFSTGTMVISVMRGSQTCPPRAATTRRQGPE